MAMPAYTALDPELRMKVFVDQVRDESIPNDVFDSGAAEMIEEGGTVIGSIPDSIYVKVESLNPGAAKARQVDIPLRKALSGDPVYGATSVIGTEEQVKLLYFAAYNYDVAKAVITENYGQSARDYAPYLGDDNTEGLAKAMGVYFKELKGMHRRQALLTGASANLWSANGGPITKTLSSNWFFPNTSMADNQTARDAYSATPATWANIVADALTAAGTGVAAAGDVSYLGKLEEWAKTTAYIKPVPIPGAGEGYIVVLPTPVIRRLKDPANKDNNFYSMGQLYVDGSQLPPETRMAFGGILGNFGDLYFVADNRYPTLGYDASTVTPYYRAMGNDTNSDPRKTHMGTGNALCGFLLGNEALYEWNRDPMHWEYNYEEYDRRVGAGIFTSYGIQTPLFTNAGGTAFHNQGSIVLPFSNPASL